jgi:hypothetical protein
MIVDELKKPPGPPKASSVQAMFHKAITDVGSLITTLDRWNATEGPRAVDIRELRSLIHEARRLRDEFERKSKE